jgi:acetyl esterase/lipase
MPVTGLTICKPSLLWPPPPDDVYLEARGVLRSAVRGVVQHKLVPETEVPAIIIDQPDVQPRFKPAPAAAGAAKYGQTLHVSGEDEKLLNTAHQFQLYTTNALLKHPLVSPVLAYLGGLPPLFIVASDREVLRDEIIYTSVCLRFE